MIELKNVSKQYNQIEILKNINVSFPNHGLIIITGKSGAGKTTLLNLLAGIEKPTTGSIVVNEKNITSYSEKQLCDYLQTTIGYSFQAPNLWENFTVQENLLMLTNKEITKEKADTLLRRFNIEFLKDQRVKDLSRGEQQRISLLRAIIKDSPILLVDEPTGNLDEETSKNILNILKEMSKEKLVIVVTHEVEWIKEYVDQIYVLEQGNLSLQKNGKQLEIDIPKKTHNPQFISKHNILKLSTQHLKESKFRSFISVALLTFTIFFALISFALNSFSLTDLQIKTMQKEGESSIMLSDSDFKEEDLNEIKKFTQSDEVVPTYQFYQNQYPITFQYATNTKKDLYHANLVIISFFAPITNLKIDSESIIGRLPEKENEIVISEYIADTIISNGIIIKDTEEEIPFYPSSYEDILKNSHYKFGTIELNIVGIIRQDLEEYTTLENVFKEEDATLREKALQQKLFGQVETESFIYGNDSFIEYMKSISNAEISKYSEIYFSPTNTLLTSPISALEKEIETSVGYISTLKEDEVIISEELVALLGNDFEIGTTISLTINNQIYELKIKGVSLDNKIYMNNEATKNAYSYQINNVIVNQMTPEIQKQIFDAYPITKGKAITKYSYSITSLSKYLDILAKISQIVAVIFAIITVLVLINTIENSITSHKKEIGLLKCLGTPTRVISRIYRVESSIIGNIAFIFASVMSLLLFAVANNLISNLLGFYFHPFILSFVLSIVLWLVTNIIIVLICAILIKKISRLSPLEALKTK